MTQGIRDYVVARFSQHLPQFRSGELTGTQFRKTVMDGAVMQFNISVASAATHYNHALQLARAADSRSVEGLGRPEGKKGGRKPIHLVDVIKVKTGEVVATGISRGAGQKLIDLAAARRRAKLAIKEAAPAAV